MSRNMALQATQQTVFGKTRLGGSHPARITDGFRSVGKSLFSTVPEKEDGVSAPPRRLLPISRYRCRRRSRCRRRCRRRIRSRRRSR